MGTIQLVAVLDQVRAHLTQHHLPALAAVTVYSWGQAALQICHGQELPGLAAALLSWAETVQGVTGRVSRTPTGETVLLSVTGQLGGVTVKVYGSAEFRPERLGGELEPDTDERITLEALLSAAGQDTL